MTPIRRLHPSPKHLPQRQALPRTCCRAPMSSSAANSASRPSFCCRWAKSCTAIAVFAGSPPSPVQVFTQLLSSSLNVYRRLPPRGNAVPCVLFRRRGGRGGALLQSVRSGSDVPCGGPGKRGLGGETAEEKRGSQLAADASWGRWGGRIASPIAFCLEPGTTAGGKRNNRHRFESPRDGTHTP